MKYLKATVRGLGLLLVLFAGGSRTTGERPKELTSVQKQLRNIINAKMVLVIFAGVAGIATLWCRLGSFTGDLQAALKNSSLPGWVFWALVLLIVAVIWLARIADHWAKRIDSTTSLAALGTYVGRIRSQTAGLGKFASAVLTLLLTVYATGAFPDIAKPYLAGAVAALVVLCFNFLLVYECDLVELEIESAVSE